VNDRWSCCIQAVDYTDHTLPVGSRRFSHDVSVPDICVISSRISGPHLVWSATHLLCIHMLCSILTTSALAYSLTQHSREEIWHIRSANDCLSYPNCLSQGCSWAAGSWISSNQFMVAYFTRRDSPKTGSTGFCLCDEALVCRREALRQPSSS